MNKATLLWATVLGITGAIGEKCFHPFSFGGDVRGYKNIRHRSQRKLRKARQGK